MRNAAFAVLTAMIFVCGCGEAKAPPAAANPPPATPPTTPNSSGYSVVEVKNGGALKVSIYYKGKVKQSKMPAADPVCAGGALDDLVVSADKLLKDAVVYLKINEGKDFAAVPVPVVDQKGCIFAPHVTLCQPGKGVVFHNSDAIIHNIHVLPFANREANFSVSQGGESTYTPQFPEFIRVKCDVHPWMNIHLIVQDHPYYAITGADGLAELVDIPPGKYTLKTWHPALEAGLDSGNPANPTAEVEIKAGQKTEISLEFAPR